MSRHPHRRRRTRDPRAGRGQPAPRRLRGRRSPATPRRRRPPSTASCRPGAARLDAARPDRPCARAPLARRAAHARAADHHAHRARRGDRQGRRPRCRRRRLHHQAVLDQASWWRASARCCAGARPTRSMRAVEIGALTLDPATRRVTGNGREVKIGADRVPAAALPDDAPGPRVLPHPAARPGLGRPRLHRGAHRRRAHRRLREALAPGRAST